MTASGKKIYKYVLFTINEGMESNVVDCYLPRMARIVAIQMQGDNLCIWAEVFTDEPMEKRTFAVVGTGHEHPVGFWHVGTAYHGQYVWHLLEKERTGEEDYVLAPDQHQKFCEDYGHTGPCRRPDAV